MGRQETKKTLSAVLDQLDHIVDLCGWGKEPWEVSNTEHAYRSQFLKLQEKADKLKEELGI